MARKIKAKLIIELREQGQSRRSIAKTRHMSMESVCEVFDIAAERGIAWADVKDVPEDEVYRLFYPDRHVRESVFDEPDWDYVHKEMANVGVNLRLLHDEYKSDCARRHMVAMGYTRFCERYGDHVAANNLTKRIEHKAGVSCEVDWSGPTIGKGLVDATTGEVSRIYLFVGVLPFSQKAYFEPTLDMKERTWLRCRVHMFEFWGGVPERTVRDNLKTGVVKHPREGETVLNDAYEALGEHYMTAIMPAQVRKPKQKASAEGTVKDAATWVIAQLRNRVFADFDEVRAAVRECLEAYNAHPFQKREGSRDLVFFEVEAAQLRPLPPVRYDVAQWVYNRSVNLDFHVVYAKNRYSVPHRCAGRKVNLRVGESTIGIYHAASASQRTASCRHTSPTPTPPTRRTCPMRSPSPTGTMRASSAGPWSSAPAARRWSAASSTAPSSRSRPTTRRFSCSACPRSTAAIGSRRRALMRCRG
ncbi:IS21 family transposase [Ellagibacter isourolithinifaciens]|uniref:IS21 family transposase n=1 Tax=Ellagibacter isourolithinifaciens TaxID=2137581 RepID=UPI003F8B8120